MPQLSTEQQKTRKINREIFSLTPSSLVTLFIIDTRNLHDDPENDSQERVFRLHNMNKLRGTTIIWPEGFTRNNEPIYEEFYPCPIQVEGFEISGKGTLPTPKLSISVNTEGIPSLALLKQQLYLLGDLSGAKVTRVRTFAKFLPADNFAGQDSPVGFEPDPYAELPRDVFYIDRKTQENKHVIEYQLASLMDVEGYKLPGRVVLSDKCVWRYRGHGCCYERKDLAHFPEHQTLDETVFHPGAQSISTELNESVTSILSSLRPNSLPRVILRGKYDKNATYVIGDEVYLFNKGVKDRYVAKVNNPPAGPPNIQYWIADMCDHTLRGCRARWGTSELPFGGFPGLNRQPLQ